MITNNEGKVVGVVSQSTIAKYLQDNLHRIKYDPSFKGEQKKQEKKRKKRNYHEINLTCDQKGELKKGLFSDSVWNFPYKTESVKVVKQNTMVLDAFAQMRANNLAAVGVTNDEGKLVGNLSATDLHVCDAIHTQHFRSLICFSWFTLHGIFNKTHTYHTYTRSLFLLS